MNKNDYLITSIHSVQIKAISHTGDALSNFFGIYSSYSKSNLSINSQKTNNGLIYNNNLNLSYPGLSENDFMEFDEMLHNRYVIIFKTTDLKNYQLGNENLPLDLKTRFDVNKGTSLIFSGKTLTYPQYIKLEDIDIDGFPYTLTTNF